MTAGQSTLTTGVVVVADQLVFRQVAREVVAATPGFEMLGEAASGEHTLEVVDRLQPDLVLLDVRMPEMSGIEVCRELRAGSLGSTVPIIMLTARARPQDLEQGFAAGATEYIVKPFSTRDLQDRVEAALGQVGS